MARPQNQTISIALVEADAAIAVLDSAVRDKLSDVERRLILKARDALAAAEERVREAKALATDAAGRL